MHVLQTSIQQMLNVVLANTRINDLVAVLPELGRTIALHVGADLLDRLQDKLWLQLRSGAAELVCTRCGIVHRGESGLVRRGSRRRKLKTSTGVFEFRLHQVTCCCKRTWSPFADWLGLKPRQRFSEELERKLTEWVTEFSYGKTCAIADDWLGATLSPMSLHTAVQRRGAAVRFTPAPECEVVQADGTKVPAGPNPRGTDVWLSLQILGREKEHGRTKVIKRIAGWGMGPRAWEQALPAGIAGEQFVTDREKGVAEWIRDTHPEALHGLCEWHLPHTLDHFLLLDGVKVRQREPYVKKLCEILSGPLERRREAYTAFTQSVAWPKARRLLEGAAASMLYDQPRAERTTSIIEREMREINRRTDVGVRWSVSGVNHMLRLRHSKRINPDDFERVWSTVQKPVFSMVPLN
jgi:hypothetical protein